MIMFRTQPHVSLALLLAGCPGDMATRAGADLACETMAYACLLYTSDAADE